MIRPGKLHKGRIMIVDDSLANLALLEGMLVRGGFSDVCTVPDERHAVEMFESFAPDLLLLDIHMPHMDGFAVWEALQPVQTNGVDVPVLILTADSDSRAREAALALGAKDFLTKPFEMNEVLLRIRNLLETRFLQLQLHFDNELLEEKVVHRTMELENAQVEILDKLALAAEFRDDATLRHTRRVGRTSALIAEALDLPGDQVDLVRQAAPLHDVGKIGVPDEILLKEAHLTDPEFERLKTHTSIGARILSNSPFMVLRLAEDIAISHHEHWDGSGYPDGLAKDEIPLVGRIVALADVFDALTHRRPYKRAWPVVDALEEIDGQRGRQFDPDLVDVFLRVQEKVELVRLPE